jgi:peptide/nickel transport system permease protein
MSATAVYGGHVQAYFVRRIALMVPTLLGVTLLVFVMVRLYPGDVLAIIAGDYGAIDQETKDSILREFQLDKNVPTQYVLWLARVSQFDFGKSLVSGRSVREEIGKRLPVSLQLGLMALTVNVFLAVPIGVISALKRNSVSDYVGRSFATAMLAAPNFWIALLLIALAGRYFQWGVPPASYPFLFSDPISNMKFMAVPAVIIGASASGGLMRFTRTAMLEVLRQDYVRTAYAKGLHESTVILRHALKNALIPVVTIVGLSLPGIIAGSVIIETVYSIPGMGRYYVTSVRSLDFPVVQAINVISAVVLLCSNLAVDMSYSWLDPRIRYR